MRPLVQPRILLSLILAAAAGAAAPPLAEPLDGAAPSPAPASVAPPSLPADWRTPSGSMPLAVIEAVLAERDGRLVLLGGLDSAFEATAAIQILDPRQGWLPIGSQLGVPRAGARSVLLHDGRVAILGGFAGAVASPVHHEDGELLDPLVAGSSRVIEGFGGSLEGLTATPLPAHLALVAAGDRVRVLDLATLGWSEPAALSPPRRHHLAIPLGDGQVLLLGGADSAAAPIATLVRTSSEDPTAPPIVEEIAIDDASASFPARLRHAASAPIEGGVIIAGGLDPESLRTSERLWRFDEASRSLGALPSLPQATGASHLLLASIDQGVVVVGGEWRVGAARGPADFSLVLERDPSDRAAWRWRSLPPLPVSGSRRMLRRTAEGGVEILGGYRFRDRREAEETSLPPGATFDPRRYRLSLAPFAAGD